MAFQDEYEYFLKNNPDIASMDLDEFMVCLIGSTYYKGFLRDIIKLHVIKSVNKLSMGDNLIKINVLDADALNADYLIDFYDAYCARNEQAKEALGTFKTEIKRLYNE